jgi:type I restriction enzyme M protein
VASQQRLDGTSIFEPKPPLIEDFITGRPLRATPEEKNRQIFARKLVKEYNYSPKQIQTVPEFYIRKGRQKIGPADIVVFYDENKTLDNVYMIVETKREGSKEGLEQLKSYMNPTKAKFGIWFNGREISFIQTLNKRPFWRDIPDIPKSGQSLEDIGLYQKNTLVPATELKTTFETCHNYIYANEGLLKEKVFNEVLKLIFMKMVDEKAMSQVCEFRITDAEMERVEEGKNSEFEIRIEKLFSQVKKQYDDVFVNENETINLKIPTVAKVVSLLQKYSLLETPADVKGIAFQTFVHAHERGERGEFFTPYPILELAVRMLDPQPEESLLDPCCGSGGFLVRGMRHVFDKVEKTRPDLPIEQREKIKEQYARSCIRGIDINPDLARVAKMHMIIYDDGHTGIFAENSLIPIRELTEVAMKAGASNIVLGSFRNLLTNPPFGTKGKVTNRRILEQFNLAHKWRRSRSGKWEPTLDLMDSQVPDILFIERCLDFLMDYGRMAIVVPDGILTNASLEYVRGFIMENARIIAVVSLPQETFIPHGTGSKTSLLLLQKIPKNELVKLGEADYPIFMAVCERIGYDVRGKTIFKKNKKGELVKDKGVVVSSEDDASVDTDIPEIIEAFDDFKKQHDLGF